MALTIFTDGSCLGNPGRGGWAFVVVQDGKKIYENSGYVPDTTNNRMEMQALVEALKWAIVNEATHVIVYSDSKLLVSTIELGWKRKANTDIWLQIEELLSHITLKMVWVKAHDKSIFNNRADLLANNAAHSTNKHTL